MTEHPSFDTLLFPRWIIPVEPAGTVLSGHALGIREGRIAALLPVEEARRAHAKETQELPDHALCPGLVNAHGHAAMSLFRGMADDYDLHNWLHEHIWPAEGRWVGEAFVSDGTRLAAAEMIRSGTTCCSDMYFFPDVSARVIHEAGLRAQIAFPVLEFSSAWAGSAEEYIHKGVELRDDYKHSDRLRVVFGPHAPYTVSDQTLAQIATYTAELDCPVHIHLHETEQEVAQALKERGERPLARLHTFGLLTPRTQCVHMTALEDADIDLVAENGAHVIHCPESNLKLASGFCPVQKLLDAGVNVALGTDGAASNNDLDLFGEMRTAAMLAKAVAGDAAALPAARALWLATMGGARALGMDAEIGSLEPGKQADIIAVDLSGIEHQPLYDPMSQLVYTHCGGQVTHSWVAGKPLLKERRLLTLDSTAIGRQAEHWRQQIDAERA